jgi:hypothetical protein
VDFSDVEFGRLIRQERLENVDNHATIFRFVTFESDVFFIRANFYGSTSFENVNFKREANFTNAEFIYNQDKAADTFSLSYLNFKSLILNFGQLPQQGNWVRNSDDRIKSYVDIVEEQERKEHLEQGIKLESMPEKELQPLSQVLAGLEATFREENRLDDRNRAYYHMKNAEFEEKTNETSFEIAEQSLENLKSEGVPDDVLKKTIGDEQTDKYKSSLLKHTKQVEKNWGLNTWERWEWILWGWSSGYGTKIWWLIGWYFGFFALFTAIYWELGIFYRTKTNEDSSFKLRLVVFPWQYFTPASAKHAQSITPKLIEAVRLSKELILKLGYGNITISGSNAIKTVVVIEWVLGFYLLALLVITLSYTSPLLNKLISGVF